MCECGELRAWQRSKRADAMPAQDGTKPEMPAVQPQPQAVTNQVCPVPRVPVPCM